MRTPIMPISYKPRGDRIIVKRLARPAPNPGELALPESQTKELNEGIVVAVGPGVRDRVTGRLNKLELEPGDHVCFLEFAGAAIEVDGEEYLSLRDEEVHGVRVEDKIQ